MARKKVLDELTKEMIIAEANRQLLISHFNDVSMRAIAKALGCSHGAIYYHFTNKLDLFSAVIAKYFEQLNSRLEEALVLDREAGTRNVLLGYIEFGLTHQTQYEFMFAKRDQQFDPLLQKAPNESYHKFCLTLQTLHHNKLNPDDIYSTYLALHGFVMTYIGRVYHYEEALNVAQHHCNFLIKALVQ